MNRVIKHKSLSKRKGRGGFRPGAGRKAKTLAERLAATGEKRTHAKIDRGDLLPTKAFLDFVQHVALERESFSKRITANNTICTNLDGSEFTWPNSAAKRMRDYAQKVIGGEIVACELVKLSARRFIDDLQHASERGLFFDPVAAENILQWFTDFNVPGFVLQDWQLFLVGQIFAWKNAAGLRRFRECWCEVPKKSGKTFLMSGVALFCLLCDQEPNPEIYGASNSKDQSKICFRSAKRILDECPNLHNAARAYHSAFVSGSGFYHPVSSDGRTIDGPNVHVCLFDEVHEFRDSELWDKLNAGVVARRQPLTFASTTAGESPSGFCWERHSYFVKLLTGVAPNDSQLVLISAMDEGDDWADEKVWAKVNLNLNVSVYVEALRAQAAEIAEFPAKLTPFLRYHLNSWSTAAATRSIPLDKLRACSGPYKLPPRELREWFLTNAKEQPCWGGLDIGLIEDMSCFCALYPEMIFDRSSTTYMTAIPYFWIPEARVAEKKRRWNIPLDVWIKEGFVKVTPGDYTDLGIIKQDLRDIIFGTGHFFDCGYDSWNCQTLAAELHDSKICCFTRVPQTQAFLTTPSKEFLRAIAEGRFVHLANPVLLWHLSNVILEPDERGGILPRKASKNEKIDGVQALLNALQRYLNPDESQKFLRSNPYNNRGVVFV